MSFYFDFYTSSYKSLGALRRRWRDEIFLFERAALHALLKLAFRRPRGLRFSRRPRVCKRKQIIPHALKSRLQRARVYKHDKIYISRPPILIRAKYVTNAPL